MYIFLVCRIISTVSATASLSPLSGRANKQTNRN